MNKTLATHIDGFRITIKSFAHTYRVTRRALKVKKPLTLRSEADI